MTAKREDFWALALGLAAVASKPLRARRRFAAPPARDLQPGISVVIPSREGRHLLEAMLGGVEADLAASGLDGEIIVVDNGSRDGTTEFLRQSHPRVRVEEHAEPLAFARAANRGASLARYRRLCLLNNDMEVSPGFFAALDRAFAEDPALFCASAQIFFPAGARREETGKTALRRAEFLTPDDYPVFCDEPLEGEDSSPVLYGSGGCSLYDLEKFHALGGFDEFYQPAYVEDLDLGYRAWLRGWPSVYVARARVLHRHRATSSRYYSDADLARLLEINFARFLLRAVQSPAVFRRYYPHTLARLRRCRPGDLPLLTVARLVFAAAQREPVVGHLSEPEILALTGGGVRVFPGRGATRERRVLVSAGSCRTIMSAGSRRPCDSQLTELASGAAIHYLAYCRPRSLPEPGLLDLARAVILVDGPAGEVAYRAAQKEAQRRYSIEESVVIEKGGE
ncbi:MAG TPA: glycosyltransferase family 2 protein [Bryobacterales bacterium]|nr:glycosyltransferase family 2 protein [Bryobacterales bacterium]